MRGHIHLVATDPTQHFVGSLAPGGISRADLPFPQPLLAGLHGRSSLKHLTILSLDNCAWEILLYSRTLKDTGLLSTDSFRSRLRFSASDAVLVNGLYYYHVPGLDVPYEDEDRTGSLHLALVNRSPATTKTQALLVKLFFEETYG